MFFLLLLIMIIIVSTFLQDFPYVPPRYGGIEGLANEFGKQGEEKATPEKNASQAITGHISQHPPGSSSIGALKVGVTYIDRLKQSWAEAQAR